MQTYFDYSKRVLPPTYDQNLGLFDIELQHQLLADVGQQLTWGAGYRSAADRVRSYGPVAFLPARRRLQWANVFAQYERRLAPTWSGSVGARNTTSIPMWTCCRAHG